jgi:hypothetical protein
MTWALYGSVSNEPNLAAAALLFSFHAQMMWMNDPRSREHFCSQLILAKIAPRRPSWLLPSQRLRGLLALGLATARPVSLCENDGNVFA